MNSLRQIKDRLAAKVMLMFPALLHSWAKKGDFITHDESPFAPLTQALPQCRVALVTTGGIHLKDQPPFNMDDPQGDPSFREIPATAEQKDLTITHNYYDHSDADKDINIVLPLKRIRELVDTGEIKSVNTRHFSFMGHITGPHINTLIQETAPQVANMLKEDQVDIVILTPTWGICNQSVGLIQRVIENQGIPTVSITLSPHITKKVLPPRALYPGFPMGHPLSYPGQAFRQLQILRILLNLVETADKPGTLVEMDLTGKDDKHGECVSCGEG